MCMNSDYSTMLDLSEIVATISVQNVFIMAVSLLALLLTWKYFPAPSKQVRHDTKVTEEKVEEQVDDDEMSCSGLLTRMKVARHGVIQDKLTAGLSQQQLQEEKKIEQEQLAAIFDLLRQQEDKFHVNTMQDVQSQLKLYRP